MAKRLFLLRAISGLMLLLVGACALQLSPRQERTTEFSHFGDNPGEIGMRAYVPKSLKPGAPLVVALHHCFQKAEDYVAETGWLTLADQYGFAVLAPEQSVFNDPSYCFQWFNSWQQGPRGDEPVSIHSMIVAMIEAYHLDPKRVFVTGHSAGGSMALILMAGYPDLIAAGGVFGSLPVGQADLVLTAPVAMAGLGTDDPAELAARITEKTDWPGPWPRLSVWQGSDDPMVAPSNGPRVRDQWLGLLHLDKAQPRLDRIGPYERQTWVDASGRPAVQFTDLEGIGHSVPVDAARGCGVVPRGVSQLVSDVGVCSSLELLKFWGLVQ